MNRRQLLAGLGGLAGAGGVITSTGAFTSVDADRDATVRVSDDVRGFLQIYPSTRGPNLDQPNGTFATSTGTPGSQLALDINNAGGSASGSDGVGTGSRYVFDDIFRVRNRGTQDVLVEIRSIRTTTNPSSGSGGEIELDFFASQGADTNTTGPSFSSVNVIDGSPGNLVVPVGKPRAIGMRIETVDGSNYGGVQAADENEVTNVATTVSAEATQPGTDSVDPGEPTDTR